MPRHKQAPTPGARRARKIPVERELDVYKQELTAQVEELRRANAEVNAARERQAALFDLAPLGYFMLDTDGIVVEANQAGAAMLETRRAELFGRSFDDYVAPAERGAFRTARIRLRDRGGRASFDSVVETHRRRFRVRVDAAQHVRHGQPLALMCVADEADRTRAEGERATLAAGRIDAERRAAVEHVLGAAARALAEPLAVAAARAQSADAGSPSAVAVRRAIERARELTSDLLLCSGTCAIVKRRVDLSALVRALEPKLRKAAGPNIQLTSDLVSRSALVAGDAAALERIARVLVDNAIEAIGDDRGKILVETVREGPTVVLRVVDDGAGMDDVTCRKAFDPFFSTKPRRHGLGLAIARGIAHAHGGAMSAASQPGRGAVIRVALPAARAGREV